MKHNTLITILALSLVVTACKMTSSASYDEVIQVESDLNGKDMTLKAYAGDGHNHPTFVLWLEKMDGTYLQTLFITRSFATGIFGYGALTDTTWSNEPGASYRPAALPYWTYKKGYIDGKYLVPEKEHPYVDGYSGATPKNNFTLETQLPATGQVRLLFEVNQTWDWNRFWTNNKFPGNLNYKSSAQPSVIYAVTLNLNDPMDLYVMNPIGHGHYAGDDGKLYTDLSTLTSALEIFERVELTLK